MKDKWADKLRARFEDREDLGKERLFKEYFEPQGLDKAEVMSCFEEIEMGFHIPVGILRPSDKLTKLTERVPASNPFEWLWWLGRNEFSDQGLLEELGVRMKNKGTSNDWKLIDTFDDLVQAWCGKKPKTN
ncbi:MAG: hypothetical protein ACKVQW_00020 [Pyrinomonadaceae bacterium]